MLFSAIIPVYRVERYLRRCVKSVLAQACGDYELILVDDGSPDGCPDICDAYAAADPRVRVLHKPNGGHTSARNAGIRLAVGEYILYVDGDDWVADDWLEIISRCIRQAPEQLDLVVFGSEKVFSDRRMKNPLNLPDGFYDRARMEKEIFPWLIMDNRLDYSDAVILPASWNRAIRRELLEAHHCADEGIRLGEDNAYVFECFLCAKNAMICGKTLYYYNKTNDESITATVDENRFRKRERCFRYIKAHLQGYGPVIDRQMNDYYASRIIYDLFFFFRRGCTVSWTAKLIAREFRATGIMDYVRLRGVSAIALPFILSLKARLYWPACLAAKLFIRLKG